MKCRNCQADAVVKRGDTYFCGRCSISADWQMLIASIQDARVESPVAGGDIAMTA
jgi:hypothetical protein